MKKLTQAASLAALLFASAAASADSREFKQVYSDGNCKVEREQKKDGEYKEKRECKGSRGDAGRFGAREFKEKYSEGNCTVEREYKKDGEYKEQRECKGPRRAQGRERPVAADRVYYDDGNHRYAPPQAEAGVRIDVHAGQ